MNYTIERSRRRTITLSIRPDGTVLVKAPYLIPRLVIDQFVEKHHDWIEKRLERISEHTKKRKAGYDEGATFLYLGKIVRLTYGKYPNIAVVGDELRFPVGLRFRVKKELEAWYIAEGKRLITKQLEKYAEEMQVTYNALLFSDTRSKWGSCTHDNRLQFSWRLIMAPILVMNYVIVHELAHTTEKNHSRDFWKRVERFNPSYRQSRKWLKEYGHTLVF